ncbi:MAG: hypothetical protein SGBAC_012494, partial [Bacillariaceae sp.]
SPTFPGGGTVAFVSPSIQDYDTSIEAREDAGTPAIVQAIRTGLAFQVKEMVGCQRIEAIEREYCEMVFSKLRNNDKVDLVGSDRGAYFDPHRRVTIMSFNIRTHFRSSSSGLRGAMSDPRVMLSPHFVVALLNDVYGIQARAGCSCTGPYSHRLLDIDNETSERARALVGEGYSAFKFGWARVNFNYFISPQEVDFICDAILQIAEHGWKLLPLYEADLKSARFVCRRKMTQLDRPALSNFLLSTPENAVQAPKKLGGSQASHSFNAVLMEAEKIYEAAEKCQRFFGQCEVNQFPDAVPSDIISPDDVWWVTTKDVLDSIRSRTSAAASIKRSRTHQDGWSTALRVGLKDSQIVL